MALPALEFKLKSRRETDVENEILWESPCTEFLAMVIVIVATRHTKPKD